MEYLLDAVKDTLRPKFFAENGRFGVCLSCSVVFGLPDREQEVCPHCQRPLFAKHVRCPVCESADHAFEVDRSDASFLTLGHLHFTPLRIYAGARGKWLEGEPVEVLQRGE